MFGYCHILIIECYYREVERREDAYPRNSSFIKLQEIWSKSYGISTILVESVYNCLSKALTSKSQWTSYTLYRRVAVALCATQC